VDDVWCPALIERAQKRCIMQMPAPRNNLGGLTPPLNEFLSPAFVSLAPDSDVCQLNARAQKLLKLTGGAKSSIPLHQLPQPLADLLEQSRRSKQSLADQLLLLTENEETPRALLVSTHLVGDTAGQTLCVVLSDISPVRQVEQKMQLLDRLASIGTLSASMAHEIKNALVAIKTFVDLLLKHNKDAELAGVVSRELKRIDSIVSQMLRFAGPAKPTFATVHVHEILQHAVRLLQHQTEGRKIQLHCELNAEPDTIHGDDYQLEQAFVNILLNAVEATGPNGQIHVSTELVGAEKSQGDSRGRLAVHLRDSGAGISKENQEKLFQPFFTTKITGTGLGLAITQRIIRDHRGTVSVESELNEGTTFHVYFPLPHSKAN
jgi:signal transduction histidine kinase